MEDERKIKISALWDTLKRYDAYIATVNFKSGLITSLNLAVFGAVLLKSGELISQHNNIKITLSLVLFLVSILSLLSVVWVVKSISPKLSSKSTNPIQPSVFFFGSVAKYETTESYSNAYSNIDIDNFEKDLINQVYEVASITDSKFKLIKFAGFLTKLNLLSLIALAALILLNVMEIPLCLH